MNDKVSLFLVSLLTISIIALSYYNGKVKRKCNYYKLLHETETTVGMVDNIEYIKNLYSNEGVYLNPDQQAHSFNNNSKVDLRSLVKDGSKLIFRFKESDCVPCIDSTFAILKAKINEIEPKNIIIFSNHKVPRELILYLRTNQLKLDSYFVKKIGNLPWESNTPFFFDSENDMQVIMFHEVNKKIPILTEKYLQQVSKRIKN